MSIDEGPFRRLLRWYPGWWRQENGKILLSTLLDAAEHDGRRSPATAERLAAALHGIAARVNRRFAVVLSVSAMGFAVLAGVLWVWAPGSAAELRSVLSSGLAPGLAALALIAIIRERGLLGDGRAIVAMVLSMVALGLNALTFVSWFLAFEAADAGVPSVGLAASWLPLFAVGVFTGATAIALVTEALFRRRSLSASARIALAGLVGVIAAPLIGFALLGPFVGAAIALGVAALAHARPRHGGANGSRGDFAARSAPLGTEVSPSPGRASTREFRSTARLLAAIAATGGVVGGAYALTGAQWSPGAADTTLAMGQGITILLLSGVPLASALGLLVAAAPSRVGRLHSWGPLSLVAIALGPVAVAYLYAPSWEAMAPWFQVGSIIIGGGIAWWVISRARLPYAGAVVVGVFAGASYAAFVGVMLAPLLGVAVPVIALVVAVRRVRDLAESEVTAAGSASAG